CTPNTPPPARDYSWPSARSKPNAEAQKTQRSQRKSERKKRKGDREYCCRDGCCNHCNYVVAVAAEVTIATVTLHRLLFSSAFFASSAPLRWVESVGFMQDRQCGRP